MFSLDSGISAAFCSVLKSVSKVVLIVVTRLYSELAQKHLKKNSLSIRENTNAKSSNIDPTVVRTVLF